MRGVEHWLQVCTYLLIPFHVLPALAVGNIGHRAILSRHTSNRCGIHLCIVTIDILDAFHGDVCAVLACYGAGAAYTQHLSRRGACTQVYVTYHDTVVHGELGVVSPSYETADTILVGIAHILHLTGKHDVLQSEGLGAVVAVATHTTHIGLAFNIQVDDDILQNGRTGSVVTDEACLSAITYGSLYHQILNGSIAHLGKHTCITVIAIHIDTECVTLSVESSTIGLIDANHLTL